MRRVSRCLKVGVCVYQNTMRTAHRAKIFADANALNINGKELGAGASSAHNKQQTLSLLFIASLQYALRSIYSCGDVCLCENKHRLNNNRSNNKYQRSVDYCRRPVYGKRTSYVHRTHITFDCIYYTDAIEAYTPTCESHSE